MNPLLPLELRQKLREKCPSRAKQLEQLSALYNTRFPPPPVLVAYGLEETDKRQCITNVLDIQGYRFTTVKCADCLSQRHLLSRIFAACTIAVNELKNIENYGKIDTLNSLVVNLQKLFERTAEDGTPLNLVLVLDGIDEQRGGTATLLPALARLPDIIQGSSTLSLILISSSPRPLPLHRSGTSYIHFPPYSRNEAIHLVTRRPPALQPPQNTTSDLIHPVAESILLPIYTQFCAAVYDSLIVGTSSTSQSTFSQTCAALWPVFVWPLLSQEPPPTKAKSWDFQRLFIRNKALFQNSGEAVLVDHLHPLEHHDFTSLQQQARTDRPSTEILKPENSTSKLSKPTAPPLLSRFCTLLLLSSYLTSHTSPKLDILLFSRLSSSSKSSRTRKNYHRRKLLKAASASVASSAAERSALKAAKKLFDGRSGVGRPFPLERVIAVFRAVHPEGLAGRKGVADRVYRGVAELERLGLLKCVDPSIDGESETLWRVNVNRSWVEGMAERLGLGVKLADYEVQGD